jgi:hypothetical protein
MKHLPSINVRGSTTQIRHNYEGPTLKGGGSVDSEAVALRAGCVLDSATKLWMHCKHLNRIGLEWCPGISVFLIIALAMWHEPFEVRGQVMQTFPPRVGVCCWNSILWPSCCSSPSNYITLCPIPPAFHIARDSSCPQPKCPQTYHILGLLRAEVLVGRCSSKDPTSGTFSWTTDYWDSCPFQRKSYPTRQIEVSFWSFKMPRRGSYYASSGTISSPFQEYLERTLRGEPHWVSSFHTQQSLRTHSLWFIFPRGWWLGDLVGQKDQCGQTGVVLCGFCALGLNSSAKLGCYSHFKS